MTRCSTRASTLAVPAPWRRLLRREGLAGDRRLQQRHSAHAMPSLVATGPNQIWTWDITKLKAPGAGIVPYAYAIIDMYSRAVVGWMVAERESEILAAELIRETCRRQNIEPNPLVIHADRGSAMRSKTVADLLTALEIGKSHSRPYCSNDNPHIECPFKTMKYRPTFPKRFGSIEDARQFCREFFVWHNTEHRHSGIASLTPGNIHNHQADEVLRARDRALTNAYSRHLADC